MPRVHEAEVWMSGDGKTAKKARLEAMVVVQPAEERAVDENVDKHFSLLCCSQLHMGVNAELVSLAARGGYSGTRPSTVSRLAILYHSINSHGAKPFHQEV